MNRQEAIASATDTSSTPKRSAVINSRIAKWRAKTSSGQCHRDSDYEISPVNTRGRALRIRSVRVLGPDPDQITSAAPTAGISAAWGAISARQAPSPSSQARNGAR